MQHDASYKLLFSHAEMVAELLRGYVREPWVDELDFASLEKVNAGYVSEDLRQREDDVVWRVKLGPRWIYLYLLLEFQSRVDPFMAARLLTYVGLLYQDLIRQGQVADRLPPVLPIVIYNGERPWTAATELAQLIEPIPSPLRRYQPNLHYWLLDENRLPEAELPEENPVSAMVLLERSHTPEEMLQGLERVLRWLDAEAQRPLRRAFAIWVQRVLLRERLPGQTFAELNELHEVRDMLSERVKEWTEQWKRDGMAEGLAEGRAEGLAKGLEKGRLEGEAALLQRLLTRRFGPLPESARQRLATADAETLLDWGERVLEARTLDEIWDTQPNTLNG
ncbi:Rpn family recombination-promoting nuclease/putative transposase [Methylomagnum sp.]